MRLLTRAEEYVLLAVLVLREESYSLSILRHIEKATRRKWTLGGIYIPLYRLEEKGFLNSKLGPPTHERGGKSKRFYGITNKGKEALRVHKRIQAAMWLDVGEKTLE